MWKRKNADQRVKRTFKTADEVLKVGGYCLVLLVLPGTAWYCWRCAEARVGQAQHAACRAGCLVHCWQPQATQPEALTTADPQSFTPSASCAGD